MNHTGVVFAALVFAFVVYITAKQELRQYVQVLTRKCGGGLATPEPVPNLTPGGSPIQTPNPSASGGFGQFQYDPTPGIY